MRKSIQVFSFIVILALFLTGCSGTTIQVGNNGSSSGRQGSSSSSNTQTPKWGQQTQTSGCQANGALQDKQCTPGDIIPGATASQICVKGYAKSVRNVPVSVKNQAYKEYGIYHHTTGQYEVDHLVSLELGGSNDISNLWPEAASPKPGFHEKDQVENYLHDQVCSGKIALRTAQAEIATNWLTIYNRMPKSVSGANNGD
jgi:hypothetical protein